MKIWKFLLSTGHGEEKVVVPQVSRVLSVGVQGNRPVLWCECEPGATTRVLRVFTAETGKESPADTFHFLGTLLMDGGNYVLHVYCEEAPRCR